MKTTRAIILGFVGTFTIVSCQNGSSSTTQFAAGKPAISATSAQVYTAYNSTATSPNYTQLVASLGQTPLADHYIATINATTNDAVQIGSYIFDGIHDRLMNTQDALNELANKYTTQADYWSAIGLDPGVQVNQADFEDGLAVINKYYIAASGAAEAPSNDELIAMAKANIVFASLSQQAQQANLMLAGSSSGGSSSTQAIHAAGQAVAGAEDPAVGVMNAVGDMTNNIGKGIGAAGQGIGSAAQGIGQAIADTKGSQDNNNVCAGSNSIVQDGDSNTVGPIGTNKALGGTGGDNSATCPATTAAGQSSRPANSQTNNNGAAGSNSIVQNGNVNSVALVGPIATPARKTP